MAVLGLWTLNDANAAVVNTQQFADKLNLTGKVRCNLLEIAFIVSSLPSSQHVSRDTDRLLALRKAYERLMC